MIGTIQPRGRMPLYGASVETYVYILEGELEMQTEGHAPHLYKACEAYIEALNRRHQLFNKGAVPARVLVVFVGEHGRPITVTVKQSRFFLAARRVSVIRRETSRCARSTNIGVQLVGARV